MDSQETRRSQRIRTSLARRPPIEVITICSSSSGEEDNELQVVGQKSVTTSNQNFRQSGKRNVPHDAEYSQSSSPSQSSSSNYEDVRDTISTERSRSNSRTPDGGTPKQASPRTPTTPFGSTKSTTPETTADNEPQNAPTTQATGPSKQDDNPTIQTSASPTPESVPSPGSSTNASEESFSSVRSPSSQVKSKDVTPKQKSSHKSTTKPPPSPAQVSPKSIPSTPRHSQPRPTYADHDELFERVKRRKLILEKIVGAIKPKDSDLVEFVVKWQGLHRLERISIKELKILFPEKLVEFMCQHIKWRNKSDNGRPRGRPRKHSSVSARN